MAHWWLLLIFSVILQTECYTVNGIDASRNNQEHLVFVEFHPFHENDRHKRAAENRGTNRNQKAGKINKANNEDLESFDLPEYTTVTVRGVGDPITIDLKKKPTLLTSDQSVIFSMSSDGKVEEKALKTTLKKRIGYYTTLDGELTFQISCKKSSKSTKPKCKLRGGVKNEKEFLTFVETEAKENNEKMKAKLKELKKEIREKELKKGQPHLVAVADNFKEVLVGDTLYPGKDRYGKPLINAPKLWDKKMAVKKKPRTQVRKSIKRAKRAVFTKDDATYRLTSYGEQRLRRRKRRSIRPEVEEEEEGIVEVLTAVDPDYVNYWMTLDPENGLDLMSTYLQYLVVDVDTRLYNMRKTNSSLKLRAVHAGIFMATEAESNWTSSDIVHEILKVSDNSTFMVLDMDESILRLAQMKNYLIDRGHNFDHITAVTRYNLAYKTCADVDMMDTTDCWEGGPTGYAYVGAMCEYPAYSVSLVEDPTRGLVQWTIAHEVGHSLGSHHDDGDCADHYLMNYQRSWISQAEMSHKTQNYFHISECAAEMIYTHLFEFLSEDMQCLWNDNLTETAYEAFFSLPRPGETFDINEQCTFVMGDGSFNCRPETEEFCWQFTFCKEVETSICKPVFVRDGTACGPDMVCRNAVCQNYTDIYESTFTSTQSTTQEISLTTTKPQITTELETTLRPQTTTESETTTRPQTTTELETTTQSQTTKELETTTQPQTTTELETTQPQTTTELETTTEPQTTTELETTTQPQITTTVETTTQSQTTRELETTTQPQTTTELETTTQPQTTTELETTTQPQITTELETTTQPQTTTVTELETTTQLQTTTELDTTTQPQTTTELETTTQRQTSIETTTQPPTITELETTTHTQSTTELELTTQTYVSGGSTVYISTEVTGKSKGKEKKEKEREEKKNEKIGEGKRKPDLSGKGKFRENTENWSPWSMCSKLCRRVRTRGFGETEIESCSDGYCRT